MPRRAGPEAPGTKPRATLSDVARRAGVSVSVVSRELNRDPALRARPETRKRIHRAASELGYTPSHAARSLRLSRTFSVGLIVPDLTSPIYERVIRGIEYVADELGYQLLMGRTERLEPGGEYLHRLLSEGRADGFLIQRKDITALREFGSLIDDDTPVVLLNSRGRRRGSVVMEDDTGARLATQHLLDLGHRDIAFIGGDIHSYTGQARERGYVQAIRGAGMRRRSAWILHAGYDPSDGRAAIHELCGSGGRRPSGVVVANMNAAMGALLGAREVGLRVPEQLSVIAILDWWMAEYSSPRLTTVRMPQFELGQEAMRQLHHRLQGGQAQDVVVTDPPPELIERGSTAPPPRRMMRGRAPAEPGVTELAAVAG